jgi:hypothetical protein
MPGEETGARLFQVLGHALHTVAPVLAYAFLAVSIVILAGELLIFRFLHARKNPSIFCPDPSP